MNTYDMNANIPVLFRTYQSRETHTDCKIWEAARATSAASTLFKLIEIGSEQSFIDSGLGRSNPSRVLLDEAKVLFGPRQIGCLVSIGTGHATETMSVKQPGIFEQMIPKDIIDTLKAMATDCETTHEIMLRLFSNTPNTYFRLNVEGMQGIRFSEWENGGDVEAHAMQYMKRKEVGDVLDLLVKAIRVPTAQLTIEQLGTGDIFSNPKLSFIILAVVSLGPPVESVQHIKERKLCPLPLASFTGRRKILDKMHGYFNSDGEFQHVFVLYGLGGSGKSQLAFKFLQESQANERYDSMNEITTLCSFTILIFSFSNVFYIDATNKQMLEMHLMAITAEQSANQQDRNWILVFDNADDVYSELKTFLPACAFRNILVTTCNQELCHLATKGLDENVTEMDHEDAKNLLLLHSQVEETDQNKALAAQIVQVYSLSYFNSETTV
jgi:NB-ARC domain